MNKIRILGLVLIAIGIAINFLPRNDGSAFLMGCFIGGGTVILVTGKIQRIKWNR
ncbi:hypothetical protein [Algoriphagus chordae]|uniref:Uncharacterized protein n=1 Tax=Algoriphagus chordae TaxID=237019 RepID=A0A2W7QS41_9BACT|nr:hypothetical protein [Algoriphagus chordae]PZX51418.1 hypothetical protein LV85_02362 [Algoriphagus chordae]